MRETHNPDYDLIVKIYEETRDKIIVDGSDRGKDLHLFYKEEKHDEQYT